MPFDRHDWIVDRCGREVRYVIDFYFNEDKAGTPQVRQCDSCLLLLCDYKVHEDVLRFNCCIQQSISQVLILVLLSLYSLNLLRCCTQMLDRNLILEQTIYIFLFVGYNKSQSLVVLCVSTPGVINRIRTLLHAGI
jgi:hypothetical protein